MRTLILSDLHLGNGGPYDIFAGAAELPALLDSFTRTPTHVVLNGDSFDFLLNDDPLAVDPQLPLAQARALVTSAQTAPSLQALGRVLAAGGRATMVVGNHDLELALPDVQAVVRGALGQPANVASRLVFRDGTEPLLLEVGGARVLVTHGEHNDVANRIDYGSLLSTNRTGFQYPPGSVLVKNLLNPLKHQHRMRYMDLAEARLPGGGDGRAGRQAGRTQGPADHRDRHPHPAPAGEPGPASGLRHRAPGREHAFGGGLTARADARGGGPG